MADETNAEGPIFAIVSINFITILMPSSTHVKIKTCKLNKLDWILKINVEPIIGQRFLCQGRKVVENKKKLCAKK